MSRNPERAVAALRLAAALAIAAALSACGTTMMPSKAPRVYEQESFDLRNTYSREFVASPGDTCNAARRALLSQGYVVAPSINEGQIEARKRFQPEAEQSVVIEFSVVCSPTARGQPTAVAFVSATQERFQVKKNPTSASVGVAPFGSISLPLGSNTDQLVKVGSETIPTGRFYERFFDLVEQFLSEQMGLSEPPPSGSASTGGASTVPSPAASPMPAGGAAPVFAPMQAVAPAVFPRPAMPVPVPVAPVAAPAAPVAPPVQVATPVPAPPAAPVQVAAPTPAPTVPVAAPAAAPSPVPAPAATQVSTPPLAPSTPIVPTGAPAPEPKGPSTTGLPIAVPVGLRTADAR